MLLKYFLILTTLIFVARCIRRFNKPDILGGIFDLLHAQIGLFIIYEQFTKGV